MMSVPLRAQMSDSGGTWHLYIAFHDRLSTRWPEYDWKRTTPVPTLTERREVLARLGYEVPSDVEWSWLEDATIYDDPDSPVRLIASAPVRPTSGGGAG